MKLNRTEPKWLFTLILAFHITSIHVEASHADDARILIVGMRGDSRFSAADLLSGRKAGEPEDREIVKTPVITDEGRRMMLVTGPNLCEDDTARQSFTTALFLSSPGPHAVLVLLNLEDQEPEECDVVKRVQELLGAEVLQYCIVLLDHQQRLTGASSGIAGEMINACGGRFHMIRDSEPKPAQTAALLAEIHKLVQLNAHGFYSVLNEKQQLHSERLELLKKLRETEKILTEKDSQNVEKCSVMYETLGGSAGIIGWISLVLLTALVVYTKGNDNMLNFGAKFAALILFMVYLIYFLSPDVAIPLNLALITSLTTKLTIDHRVFEDFNFSRIISGLNVQDTIGASILYMIFFPILSCIAVMSVPLVLGSSLVFGTIISVRSWSDVLIACHAAPGVTVGAYAFIFHNEKMSRESPVFVLGSFLCCIIGATLSMGFVTVFALLGVKMTIMFLISGLIVAYWDLKTETLQKVIGFTVLTLFCSCGCVLIGSVFLILGQMMSFLKVLLESLVSSYLFYVALFLIEICRRQTASVQVTNSD